MKDSGKGSMKVGIVICLILYEVFIYMYLSLTIHFNIMQQIAMAFQDKVVLNLELWSLYICAYITKKIIL